MGTIGLQKRYKKHTHSLFLNFEIKNFVMANFEIDQTISNSYEDIHLQLSESILVWQDLVGEDREIFFYDLNTQATTQITNNAREDLNPQIAGKNIVWQSDQDIYSYNISDKHTTKIPTNGSNNSLPQISGNNIVWQGSNSTGKSYGGFGSELSDSNQDPGSYIGINLGNSGDIKRRDSNLAKLNLAEELDISWARASGGVKQWNAFGSLSPENFDEIVNYADSKDVNTYLYLEYRSDLDGGSIYDFDWYDVGRTYAQHFGDRVEAYGIINEPDHVVSGNSPEEVAFALENFADGVHSVNSDYIVTSPGLGGTPMSIERTNSFLESLAPLFNDGTLQVLNLHSYHDSRLKPHFSNIDLNSDFAPSNNFIRAKEIGEITKNISFVAGEFNYRNWKGTDEDRGIGFLTTLWNQLSVVGNGGKDDRVGLFSAPYTITGSDAAKQISMADAFSFDSEGNYNWQPNEKGQVLQSTLQLTKGMEFIHTDPQDKGIVILRGGARKMWVWQNRENFSSLNDTPIVRISGIPKDATGLAVYRWDSTPENPYAMIELDGQTSVSFRPGDILPEGQTYMLMANSDLDGGDIGSINSTTANGSDFIDPSQVTFNPDLSSNSVETQNQEIFTYNLNSNITSQLTNSAINEKDAVVSGENVVWQTKEGKIFSHNLSTGITQSVTTNSRNENPSISENNIVWRNEKNQIFSYNLASTITTQIANTSADIDRPQLEGDHLVWSANVDGSDHEIFVYDFGSQVTTQITKNNTDDGNPQISQNYIAWQGNGNTGDTSDYEIFVYDMTTKQIHQISNNSTEDKNPQISDNYVAWSRIDDDGETKIFTEDLSKIVSLTGNNLTIDGSNRNDTLNGSNTNDNINGLGKQDILNGNGGNDTLDGGSGNDNINGGNGDDLLIGNKGKDILTGGIGADIFAFNNLAEGKDTIADFTIGEDIIDISKIIAGSAYSSPNPFDYIKFKQSGIDTVVKVNRNGNLSKPRYKDLVTLQGVDANEIYTSSFDFD